MSTISGFNEHSSESILHPVFDKHTALSSPQMSIFKLLLSYPFAEGAIN